MPPQSPASSNNTTPNAGHDLDADDPTRHGPRKRRKITRSKMGCFTCRKRKKLCDETHPVCGACSRLGKICEWPPNNEHPDPGHYPGPSNHTVPQSMPSFSDQSSAIDDYAGIFGTDGLQLPSMSGPSFQPIFETAPSYPIPEDLPHHSNTGVLGGGSNGGNDLFAGRMLMGANAETLQQGNMEISSMLDDLFNPSIEEQTFQLWSNCMGNNNTLPTTGTSSTMNGSNLPIPADFTSQPYIDPGLHGPTPLISPSDTSHETLLNYFHSTLSPLLTCDHDNPAGLDYFTTLFETNPTSPAGQGLKFCVMAWAARHMATRGQIQYEVMSEKMEEQGKEKIMSRIGGWERRTGEEWPDCERLIMLTGVLALIEIKACRGDLWGYQSLFRHLCHLSASLYPHGLRHLPSSSTSFHLFENLVIHDVLTSFSTRESSLIPADTLQALAQPTKESLQPLTGLSFPIFVLIHRAAALIRRRRSIQDATWNDDHHIDIVKAAEDIQDELRDEKKRLDALTKARPHLEPHRFLHEAYRTACLLQLRSYALSHPPAAIDVGLLVRQALSLLETMYEQKLPGYTSTHWVLFISALNCVPSKTGQDERIRAMNLYDKASEILGYVNITRSQRLVQEVWNLNQAGNLWVDWMQVLEEWGWELFWT